MAAEVETIAKIPDQDQEATLPSTPLQDATRTCLGGVFAPLRFMTAVNTAVTRATADFWRRWAKTAELMTEPVTAPEWATTHRDILDLPQGTLKDFSTPESDPTYKMLILPPQAGHGPQIADWPSGQSLVQVGLNEQASVFVAGWKGATMERTNETIDDYIRATEKMVEAMAPGDQKITLVGLCQGGWQALIYAALHPEKVEQLILAGSPIDFDAGNGMVRQYAQTLPIEFYEALVQMGGGLMRGETMKAAWNSMHPLRDFQTFIGLFSHLDDRQFMERFKNFNNWFETTSDLPGDAYLQIVKELFQQNKLIKGELIVGGRKVDLANVDCDVVLVAGTHDDITPAEQVFNAEPYLRNARSVEKVLVKGAGHIGLFMGTDSIKNYWPTILRRAKNALLRRQS